MSGKRSMDADSTVDTKRSRGDTNGESIVGGSMKDESPKDGYGHEIYEIEVNIILHIVGWICFVLYIL